MQPVGVSQGSIGIEVPEVQSVPLAFDTRHEDFTAWLRAHLDQPEIFSLLEPLRRPSCVGKNRLQTEPAQATLRFGERPGAECRHGLRREWCSICEKEATAARSPSATPLLDAFDLIWPILMPPPGPSLDSPLWFPEGFTLFDFQRKGIKFLAEQPCALLGDEMGLGKSIQAIVATRLLFRSGKISSALVVCPKSLLTDWEEKFWNWARELACMKVDCRSDCRERAWSADPAPHIRIVSYDILTSDIEAAGVQSFDLCILDEAQRIKSPSTAASNACKKIRAERRWVLTGTPLENKLEDLISIFEFIKPGLLRQVDARRGNSYVKSKVAGFILRRRKSEHAHELDLPEKQHYVRWLDLLPRQRDAYNRAKQEGIVQLTEKGDSVTVTHVLALITKLKQTCNYDSASKESCKLDFILEKLRVLEDEAPDEKVLIFSQYPEKTIPYICEAIRDWSPLVYDGSLSQKQRDKVLKNFQEDNSHRILLISLKAGRLGLTMHRANHVYHYDLWWNPATASQAEDRAHRIGQKKTVFVTSFLVGNTIEQRIHDILQRKKQLFSEVIDDLTDLDIESKLGEEELFGLFGLKPPRRRAAQRIPASNGGQGLQNVTPRDFEQLVSRLFEKMGYSTKVTRYCRDGGVDIYARKLTDAARENVIIQCKHYLNGSVGVEAARALNGLLTQDHSGGVLVTSGTFSAECREFSHRTRIQLIDGPKVLDLVQKYS
jgi:hypothetical protein